MPEGVQKRITIAPSVICGDQGRLAETAQALEAAGADLLHVDVADGRFVPTIGLGVPAVKALRGACSLPIHAHLAATEPRTLIPAFADAGATIISVHVEACPNLLAALEQIHRAGVQVAVALNPLTSASLIEPALGCVERVLIMLVNPGSRHQEAIPPAICKIRELREILLREHLSTTLEVDGGVRVHSVAEIARAGADCLVVGGAVFDHSEGFAAGIAALRHLAEQAIEEGIT